jgi:hypothetical protein
VSTHLLARLINDGHVRPDGLQPSADLVAAASSAVLGGVAGVPLPGRQRVCCLALCGIHLGPLRYLNSSSLTKPYIQVSGVCTLDERAMLMQAQYFESAAATELFEFQVRAGVHTATQAR